jgi:hypothetical protein
MERRIGDHLRYKKRPSLSPLSKTNGNANDLVMCSKGSASNRGHDLLPGIDKNSNGAGNRGIEDHPRYKKDVFLRLD